MQKYSIAMAYISWQRSVYDLEKALQIGTFFSGIEYAFPWKIGGVM